MLSSFYSMITQVMMRQLSRHLLGLWTSAHKTSLSLLRRIFPIGLLNFLESDEVCCHGNLFYSVVMVTN